MRSEEGQGLTEYALILALIAIVAIVALKSLSKGLTTELTSVATSL
jgi:Flp pilus assembly pilin Flp